MPSCSGLKRAQAFPHRETVTVSADSDPVPTVYKRQAQADYSWSAPYLSDLRGQEAKLEIKEVAKSNLGCCKCGAPSTE